MADFQSQYDDATKGIDGIVSKQLASVPQWTNIPGSLTKTVSSDGYVWGFNINNDIYRCAQPCSGNWEKIDPIHSKIVDMTSDNTNVYIITNNRLFILASSNKSVTGSLEFSNSASSVFSTHTYIYVQDSNNKKQRCAKPCVGGKFQDVSDTSIRITSASDTMLYGIRDGVAVKTDELMQSEWKPILGFDSTMKSVFGQMDATALYGINERSDTVRCDGDCSKPPEVVNTQGYVPVNISPDPVSKDVWLTTMTNGALGNIFSKVDKADYTTVMNNVTPLDKAREQVVTNATSNYNLQTNVMAANNQITAFVNYFRNLFASKKGEVGVNKDTIGELGSEISTSQNKLEQIKAVEPFIIILLMTLTLVACMYLIGPILGSYVHILALLILVGGLVCAIMFS